MSSFVLHAYARVARYIYIYAVPAIHPPERGVGYVGIGV